MKYFFLALLVTASCIHSTEPKNLPSNEELQMQQNQTKKIAAKVVSKKQYGIFIEKNGISKNITFPFLELLAGGILWGYNSYSPLPISNAQWNYNLTSKDLFLGRLRALMAGFLITHGSLQVIGEAVLT